MLFCCCLQRELACPTDPVGAADADGLLTELLLLLLLMLLPSPGRLHLASSVDVDVAVASWGLTLLVGGGAASIDAPPPRGLAWFREAMLNSPPAAVSAGGGLHSSPLPAPVSAGCGHHSSTPPAAAAHHPVVSESFPRLLWYLLPRSGRPHSPRRHVRPNNFSPRSPRPAPEFRSR